MSLFSCGNLFVCWECQILTSCFYFVCISSSYSTFALHLHIYRLCTVTLHLSQRAGCFACCFLANSETCGTSGSAVVNICGVSIWCVVNGAGRHNFSYDMVVHFWLQPWGVDVQMMYLTVFANAFLHPVNMDEFYQSVQCWLQGFTMLVLWYRYTVVIK